MAGKHLLVMDDEPSFAEFVRRAAEAPGFSVTTTANPRRFNRTYGAIEPSIPPESSLESKASTRSRRSPNPLVCPPCGRLSRRSPGSGYKPVSVSDSMEAPDRQEVLKQSPIELPFPNGFVERPA